MIKPTPDNGDYMPEPSAAELRRVLRLCQELIECQDKLLCCYRLQRPASDRLLNRINKARAALAEAEKVP